MLAKSGGEVILNMGLTSSGFFSFDTLQSLLSPQRFNLSSASTWQTMNYLLLEIHYYS